MLTSDVLVFISGHYKGVDQRFREEIVNKEISIGDYVLNGGEVGAMVMIDALIRLVPGVLGDAESSECDSFSGENRHRIEFSQYTRPRSYRGLDVPEVLLSGNHEEIARWRRQESLDRTRQRRADLIESEQRTVKHSG